MQTAIYTLAHETGHILNHRNSTLYNEYRALGFFEPTSTEKPLCTYPWRKSESEDFAETIGFYVGESVASWIKTDPGNGTDSSRTCIRDFGDSNWQYETAYPKHYDFAKTVFGGVEF